MYHGSFVGLLTVLLCSAGSLRAQENDVGSDSTDVTLVTQRMQVMRDHAMAIQFRSSNASHAKQVRPEPLFRYDDIPRGYLDGAVWRWGETGRPLAIVTTELHPKYLGAGPRIVYDFLSLADFPFTATSSHCQWQPSMSAVQFKQMADAPSPVATAAGRKIQMNRLIQGFVASQVVSAETSDTKRLKLRLLPRPIDVYQPDGPDSNGAVYLFVAGRMPGVIVFLETDGQTWTYGIGRLSAPSTLVVTLDQTEVYRVPPNFGTWSGGYNASNAPVDIPGIDRSR
ncbi:hypothetical protein [Stieleria neptunia]|nr:hypothetical protein [Stieleria neptunia]